MSLISKRTGLGVLLGKPHPLHPHIRVGTQTSFCSTREGLGVRTPVEMPKASAGL